jgi:hypothetical protein
VDQVPPDRPHAGQPDPEQDPDAALEALATDAVPAGRSRRRLARAALEGLRHARRTARWGMALAALALAIAVGLAIVMLTGDGESSVAGGGGDAAAIVAAGRPANVLVRARGGIGTSLGSGVVIDATEGLVLIIAVGDRPVGGTLAGYCKAVEGIRSGDSRVLTVITGPSRRPRQVQVEFE